MYKKTTLMALALGLAACGESGQKEAAPLLYHCEGGFSFTVQLSADGETASFLWPDGEPAKLPKVDAETGDKFQKDDAIFHRRGKTASFERGSRIMLLDCPEDAAPVS